MKLKDKIAVVTGGSRGIGLAIAQRYAKEGATVVLADVLIDEAQAEADAIGGGASAVKVDVTDTNSIQQMVGTVVSRHGRIDILVNNAGYLDIEPFMEITEASYEKVFAVNTKGVLFTMQAVAEQMIQQGQGGKIVNLASQAGRRGEALVATYCASKAAVISLTQSAGLALIQHGINVNAISPGVVDTPLWDKVDAIFAKLENLPLGEKKRQVAGMVPFGRMGKPEDMTGAALFLASQDAEYIVAQTYNVDGGNWMS